MHRHGHAHAGHERPRPATAVERDEVCHAGDHDHRHGDIPLAVEAMKLGAVDFIEKPFEGKVLLAAVRTALDKSNREAECVLETSEAVQRVRTLSVREQEVLYHIVAGCSNKHI